MAPQRAQQSDPEAVVRATCLSLPGTTERRSHGAPAFFAGRQYLALWLDGHHDQGFPHLWFAAPPGVQEELVAAEPERFFRPPYVGGRGWVGLRLDGDVDPDELAAICVDAWRAVAPPSLLAGWEPPDAAAPATPRG